MMNRESQLSNTHKEDPSAERSASISTAEQNAAHGTQKRTSEQPSSPAKRITTIALLSALALIFSYIEFLFPFQPGVPGVKLGLANLVIVVILYRMPPGYALMVNLIRVLLAGLLFTGVFGMLYSLAGSILSFLVMVLLKRTNLFSIFGVSMAGGVAHNFGQLLVAMFMVSTGSLLFYFPVLIVSGILTGIAVGIGAFFLLKRLPYQIFT